MSWSGGSNRYVVQPLHVKARLSSSRSVQARSSSEVTPAVSIQLSQRAASGRRRPPTFSEYRSAQNQRPCFHSGWEGPGSSSGQTNQTLPSLCFSLSSNSACWLQPFKAADDGVANVAIKRQLSCFCTPFLCGVFPPAFRVCVRACVHAVCLQP